jgi:penicillin-binding protein 2
MTFVRDDLRPVQRRTVALLASFSALFALLLLRLWVLQVLQAPKWREMADNNRLRRVPLEAPRGTVTDVHGEVILGNRPAFQLLLFPEEMNDPSRTEAFLVNIGVADTAEIHARVAKARRTSHLPSVIADNLTWPQMAAVAAHRSEFRELEVHPASRRSLPAGPVVAHLVGQLGEVTPEQLAERPDLHPGQLVGRSGLERAYENVLGGVPGNLVVVVDALGRQVSSLDEEPPIPGRPLQTTIDLGLQRAAAAAMAGQVGAVVALDPRDGAVRVLLSQPAFDPELFAGHLEPSRWQELVSDPLKPLHDRVTQALYPPGSTIKPLFAAGALRDGLRTPADTVFCTGTSIIYGHTYRCWQTGGHGRVDIEKAIEQSCDTFFYHVAQDAGIDRLASWARTFGLGSPTGIELAGENSGLVPDDDWSRKVRGHQWYAGETISVGIGQGPILATPLQLARAYAALVNGGFLVQPYLVQGEGTTPRPLGIPDGVLDIVKRAMERVVAGSRGTAHNLADLPVQIAGKTGTAQVVRRQEGVRWQDLPWDERHHALFVGYAPVGAPRLVVAVVVEHGGDAASVAAPIAAAVLERAFGPAVETGAAPPKVADHLPPIPGPGPDAAPRTSHRPGSAAGRAAATRPDPRDGASAAPGGPGRAAP